MPIKLSNEKMRKLATHILLCCMVYDMVYANGVHITYVTIITSPTSHTSIEFRLNTLFYYRLLKSFWCDAQYQCHNPYNYGYGNLDRIYMMTIKSNVVRFNHSSPPPAPIRNPPNNEQPPKVYYIMFAVGITVAIDLRARNPRNKRQCRCRCHPIRIGIAVSPSIPQLIKLCRK